MRKIYFLIIAVLAITKVTIAQTTYTWIAGVTGDYQVASNWSPSRTTPATNDILSFNATTNINVVNTPNQTIGAIAIASGTSVVSFATNLSTNVLTLGAVTPLIYTTPGVIHAGTFLTISLSNAASFTMSSGTFGISGSTGGKIVINGALTLSGGTLDFDVAGTGGTTINGSVTYISGTFSCTTPNIITWANGSNYYHAADGSSASAVPRCIWSTGSTCNITGLNAGTTVPSGINSATNTFANFNWNCASQVSNIDLITSIDSITTNGTFSVTSTGAQKLNLAGAAGGLIKCGAYSQTGGSVVVQSSSGTTTLRVTNSFSHTGGTIDAVAGSGNGTALLDLKGDVTKGASSTWQSSSSGTSAQMNLQFSGTVTQNVTIAGTWTAPVAGVCNINISNSNLVSAIFLTGTLYVYNTNSTLTASCTVNGILTGPGSINYSGSGSGGTALVYSWIYPQTATAIEFPSSNGPKNLTINNTLGVSFPVSGFNRSISRTLTLSNGNLDLFSNTLSLTSSSLSTQLVQTSGYITSGTLSRYFPATGLPTNGTTVNSRFPFGSGANDRSLNVFFSASSLSSGGTAGTISVSHTSLIGATATTINDDITLDKRSNSSWTITTSGLTLGSGGEKISVTALGSNIGSVDNTSTLRLTDGVGVYGTLIATTGPTDAPLVGKSGLTVADITSKTLYFGSDNQNALQIIIFTWTGSSDASWTNPANWTGGVGYPSSSTEVADVSSTLNYMPTINSGTSINLYQLKVGAPITLTLAGTASVNVTDTVTFNGSASFASTSTFAYSGPSGTTQNIASLTYGNLTFSGNGNKILPATVTVTGSYTLSGTAPVITGNTFIFSGTGTQKIAAGFYNNLTITGNRGGNQIGLGNLISANTIDVAGVFTMTATNYTAKIDYNTFNFSSQSTQTIPGFTYGTISHVNGAATSDRILDPLGSTDPAHVINVRAFNYPTTATTTGSKIKINCYKTYNLVGQNTFDYNDLEIAGDLVGGNLSFSGRINVTGVFSFTATNFVQVANPSARINFSGTTDQTIPAIAGFNYDIIRVNGGSRNVTLQSSGTINITSGLEVNNPSSFAAGYGFIVTGSTLNFIGGSSTIPVLTPASGSNNYYNLMVTGGSIQLNGSATAGGNVTVSGTDASPGILITDNGTSSRTFTILGNLTLNGTSSVPQPTATLDFNSGTTGTSNINLAGNLTVSGTGRIISTGDKNGTLLFNGTNQTYNNTSSYKNGSVNFTVGNGTTATTLNLSSSLDLKKSTISNLMGTLSISNLGTLNCGTKNVILGDSSGTASFKLNAGSILITSNTGGVEGAATSASTGTISSDANLVKTYSSTASYVLNGATTTPFPAAISSMLNLTIGANVTLNHAETASGTLDLGSSILTQSANNLQFSGLTSTTGSIAADKSSSLSITGSLGTVGSLRFAPGFNTTGQFTINRPVTVQLLSDLIIDKTPLSGNYTSGTASSILDINGNTLTINGTVIGSGTLSGSATSNLTLGGTAGTISFTAGSRVLKNLTLNNSATATLGTPLDITAGNSPGNEGTVTINSTAVLTSGGNLTIKSNINGTARVAQGRTTGGYISGDVTIERYLASSAKRAWRMLAAPAYGYTIKQNWQENQAAGVDPGTGYGTIITSNSASWAADGFDYQTPGNSLLVFNTATNLWDGYPNTTSQISGAGLNKAYFIFIRGDRTATPSNGPYAVASTLRTKGTLFQGDLPAVPVPAGTNAALGNNYASAIDFTTIRDANIDQSFIVWDPKLVGAYGLGGYVTFSASNAWVPIPGGGSYTSGVPNTLIQSGQAFIVHATGGTGNITLKESSKAGGSKLVFRPATPAQIGSLTTNLYSVAGMENNIADGNVVVFDNNYSNEIDGKDVIKPSNVGENLGISRGDKILVVDARQPLNDNDTIFFNMKKLKQQTSYRFEFIPKGFDNSLFAFLEDKFLNTSTPINISSATMVDFNVTGDALSAAQDRFRIVFKSSAPLPVTFSDIKASQSGKDITVEWKVENEINILDYDVERSADGINFSKMNVAQAKGGTNLYTWIDKMPASGDNFYRIRSNELSGASQYSKTVKVNISKAGGKGIFSIYPNPVSDGMINLQMKNADAGAYSIKLINYLGQVIDKNIINHNGGSATQSFKLPKNPGDGVYQIEIISPDNKTTVLKMLVLGN